MFTSTSVDDRDLHVRITESDGQIVISFNGVSDSRDPAKVLEPLLASAVAKAELSRKELVLDFRPLSRMNSSTVPPILRVLHHAKRASNLKVTVLYARLQRWQTISFSALKAFESPDGRVTVHAG